MEHGTIIVDVEIPNDTQVFIEDNKLKAQDIIISNPQLWTQNYKLVLKVVKYHPKAFTLIKYQTYYVYTYT